MHNTSAALLQESFPSFKDGDGVVSAAQYHTRPVTGAPSPRQASCGLIFLRGCLDCLKAKATSPRVSDVRRGCGHIVPEAAQRRGPRSEAGTQSIPNHLGLLCSPIRSSVAENSKTPNPRPPFSSSPVCLHASHTLAVPCCHPPPLLSSPQRDTPWRIDPSPPHRTPSSSDWPSTVGRSRSGLWDIRADRGPPEASSSSQRVAEEGSEERESTARRPFHLSISQPPPPPPPPASTAPKRRQTGCITPHRTFQPSTPRPSLSSSLLQHSTLEHPALLAVAPRRRPRSSGLVTSDAQPSRTRRRPRTI